MCLAGGEAGRCRVVQDSAVARTLQEVDSRDSRIAHQRLDREDERPPHHAVDEETVLGGVDVRHATVMSLEVQPARRDHAVERLERRARHTAAGRSRSRGDPRALDANLVLRRLSVLAHPGAGDLHPRRRLRRLEGPGSPGGRGREATGAEHRDAMLEKLPARHPVLRSVRLRHPFLLRVGHWVARCELALDERADVRVLSDPVQAVVARPR